MELKVRDIRFVEIEAQVLAKTTCEVCRDSLHLVITVKYLAYRTDLDAREVPDLVQLDLLVKEAVQALGPTLVEKVAIHLFEHLGSGVLEYRNLHSVSVYAHATKSHGTVTVTVS